MLVLRYESEPLADLRAMGPERQFAKVEITVLRLQLTDQRREKRGLAGA